ncbi:MAG: SWIM zinc finger family protein [Chloroflexi bacterium]|nr:SWIM zinc finger family protein [Chloroflexota bacterium]
MKVLMTAQSQTDPGKHYEIRESSGGQVYCMCPAWRFSQPLLKNGQEYKLPCKHLKALGYTELHRMEVPSWMFRRSK